MSTAESRNPELGQEFARMTAFQRDILRALLREESPYAKEIKRALGKMRGEKIRSARVYSNLNELAERGFIGKKSRDKRNNEYSLTEKGKQAMREYANLYRLFEEEGESS